MELPQRQQPLLLDSQPLPLPLGDSHSLQLKVLADIQKEISSYREDIEKLDRDDRLHNSTAMKKSMEEETNTLKQSLQGMLNSVKVNDEALGDFREKVLKLLHCTEYAVRTYQRAKLWRDAPTMFKGQIMPPAVQELLSSPVILPSPYLEQAVSGFHLALEAYQKCIQELEHALLPQGSDFMLDQYSGDLTHSLPLVISHMHDYFVHVAAKLEKLQGQVGSQT
eukprot:gene19952-26660_t